MTNHFLSISIESQAGRFLWLFRCLYLFIGGLYRFYPQKNFCSSWRGLQSLTVLRKKLEKVTFSKGESWRKFGKTYSFFCNFSSTDFLRAETLSMIWKIYFIFMKWETKRKYAKFCLNLKSKFLSWKVYVKTRLYWKSNEMQTSTLPWVERILSVT